MAVFLVNTCKFNSCGITFATLTELIRHIEETHLDFDPRAVEEHESQQPSCLPISYILRVFADNSRKDSVNGSHSQSRKGVRPHSPSLSLCSTPPTDSEMDDEDNRSVSGESSIDSWVNNNVDNDSANAILKIMNPQSCQTNGNPKADETDRPFVCTNGNCKKRYRNANGLKYHTRKIHKNPNAQKKETVVSTPPAAKEYKCHCGKVYKTSHGLKNHKNIHHNNNQPKSQSQSQAQTQTSASLALSLPSLSSQTTQSSIPVQTQTTQTTSVQTNTTIVGKNAIIGNQTLSPATKESILATFVRCRPLQTLPTTTASNGVQTRLDGLPLMLTLQTDNDNKMSEYASESVNTDKKVVINGSTVRKCPAIAAPTLQQHLLSPIVGKPTQISVTKII